jgi:hypothetical protein
MNPALIGSLVCFVLWMVLGFVAPLGAGWVHLFLPAALMLLIRRVVAGRREW